MRVVYSYYVLDIVHKGHLVHMKNAKNIAGKDGVSVVGILTDEAVMEKKEKPILSFEERIDLAAAIEGNDVVIAQETYSPLPNLKQVRPDVALESTSHTVGDIAKVRQYMESINGKLVVLPYCPLQSSARIKSKIRR